MFKNPLPCLTHSFPPFYHPECHPIRNLVTFGVFDYVFKSKDNFCGKTRYHIVKYRTEACYVVVALFYLISVGRDVGHILFGVWGGDMIFIKEIVKKYVNMTRKKQQSHTADHPWRRRGTETNSQKTSGRPIMQPALCSL